MKYLNQNYVAYVFLLLRKHKFINKLLIITSGFNRSIGELCIKNEANKLFVINFAWVTGGGLLQRINVESFVNNPSPLTHENVKWRCSCV